MGEFLGTLKLLGGAIRNMQRVRKLNDAADAIVKRMTGLPPAAFTKECNDALFEQVKTNYLSNVDYGAPYEPKEVAAFKLLCYKELPLPHPFNKRVDEALRTMAREINPARVKPELLGLAAYV
ncbi:MAG: hypothetical protein ACJ8FS_15430 [Sphingomicrobium sp.]